MASSDGNGASTPPRIAFPCQYPVKVVGESSADFRREVEAVFRQHVPGFEPGAVAERESSAGNYLSLTVTIEATGESQLQALFSDLKAVRGLRLVL